MTIKTPQVLVQALLQTDPSDNKLSGYLSHPIRGKDREKATIQEQIRNCKRAIEVGMAFIKQFSIGLHVPGAHEVFVRRAYKNSMLTEQDILKIDCEILADRHFLIVYSEDGYLSHGMKVELQKADELKIPIFFTGPNLVNYLPDLSPNVIRKFRRFLKEVNDGLTQEPASIFGMSRGELCE